MQPAQKTLSLILPCYNAAGLLQEELPGMLRFLEEHVGHFEIIMVDDGSTDGVQTEAIAKQHGCLFFRQPFNMGKGAALKKGFSMASGDVQLFTDSDFPFEHTNVLHAYQVIAAGGAEVVIGDRTQPSSDYYLKVNLVRRLGSFLIAGIGKRLLKNHIIDTQCGLKGFSASAAKSLFPQTITQRFGIDFELLYLASKADMRIEKIPVNLRTNYPSSVNVVGDGLKIVQEIFRAIRHHKQKAKVLLPVGS
jgi:dolichyl-phosphate beta-glucosyltransferase